MILNFKHTITRLLYISIFFFFVISEQSCEQSDPPIKNSIRDSGDIVFSGYGWNIKTNPTPVGPGPNYFSKSDSTIYTDNNGYLHMKIFYSGNKWNCSEVVSTENLGYGTYKWVIENSSLSTLNESIVVGLFSWDNSTFQDQGNSEVDIEFSKWGNKSDTQTLTYSVQPVWFENPQPYSERTNKPKLAMSKLSGVTTHLFRWTPDLIEWISFSGDVEDPNKQIAYWKFDKNNQSRSKIEGGKTSDPIIIPAPGKTTNARMNTWLLNGQKPTNNSNYELIIRSFNYLPYK